MSYLQLFAYSLHQCETYAYLYMYLHICVCIYTYVRHVSYKYILQIHNVICLFCMCTVHLCTYLFGLFTTSQTLKLQLPPPKKLHSLKLILYISLKKSYPPKKASSFKQNQLSGKEFTGIFPPGGRPSLCFSL